jgi:hypothetical protein
MAIVTITTRASRRAAAFLIVPPSGREAHPILRCVQAMPGRKMSRATAAAVLMTPDHYIIPARRREAPFFVIPKK